MFDVSNKTHTFRTAVARAEVTLKPSTIALMREDRAPKGDPFPVAKVAAIQAAKNTSQIIPYCHPLPVDFVDCRFTVGDRSILIEAEVKATYKTGVEMEALTAASVAALTVYDMLKPVDETIEISSVRLVSKTGGKNDFYEPSEIPVRAAVLVSSDSVSSGRKSDSSGQAIVERLKRLNVEVVDYRIVPDDIRQIEEALIQYSDHQGLDLVLTTGGTGLGPRDRTPEATGNVIERLAPGISEAARSYGQGRTPRSMLSRGLAGLRGKTLIVNLPGSPGGVKESLDALFPSLLHSFKMIQGGGHDATRKPDHAVEK